MQNQFILNIKVRENWALPRKAFVLNKELFIFFFLGITNILCELTIRRFIPIQINDVFIQFSHILIFFLYPSYLIFASWGKALFFSSSLFLITIPTYFLIEKNILPFYFAVFFILTWLIYYLFFRKHKTQIKNILIGKLNWNTNFILGLMAGLLFCLHLFLVIYLSQNFLPKHLDLPKIFINFFLEANFSLLGMEFLFRYLLFLRLIERNGFSFLLAGTLSTLLFILPFLTNPSFNQTTAVIIGLIYYGLMQGFTSCWLAYKTKSLLPSIIFGLILTIFLSLIF